jgi:hypothetical protein
MAKVEPLLCSLFYLATYVVILYQPIALPSEKANMSSISLKANISWKNPQSAVNLGMQRYHTDDMRYLSRGFRAKLEQSNFLRHLIAVLSIVGVSMVMADGVLTPAQSGNSPNSSKHTCPRLHLRLTYARH